MPQGTDEEQENYNPLTEYKPFKELFTWAIICNKPIMADYLKQRGENHIAKLLVGCKLYHSIMKLYMSWKAETNRDVIRGIRANILYVYLVIFLVSL